MIKNKKAQVKNIHERLNVQCLNINPKNINFKTN